MKKKLASLMLLLFVTVGTVGVAHSAINGGKSSSVCHDRTGKWNPQSKDCNPDSCGCIFHQIEEFLKGIFR